MTPRATYRVQFHKDFTFDDAAERIPYLAALGISHLYASPFFASHPGSTHGYDVVDYNRLNPELGGAEAFGRLSAALSAAGMRLLLDFVPNHMGVGGADNAFWLDLLEWGEAADHAGWFDIDWTPDRVDIRGKVLVPFLGDQYGKVLEDGGLALRFDAADGSFAVWAHETHKLPVCPLDYERILGRDNPKLLTLGDSFADVMRWRPQIMRRARELKAELARVAAEDGAVRAAIEGRLGKLNGRPGDFASWSALAALIDRQNWRPSHHLVASDDINYRRFFNIATLAGVRMELPDVFDDAHRLVLDMLEGGQLDGLRIDHIDGLFDPKAYLRRLRSIMPAEPDGSRGYLVVEKILGPDEALRDDWPVEGTTGYDFTNLLTGLFVRRSSEGAFTRLYRSFTGETRSFEAIVHACKLQIMDNEMLSELNRLARSATRIAREDARTADFTLTGLQRALRLIVSAFPVYRTYVDGESAIAPEDRARIRQAIEASRFIDPAIEPSVFDFLGLLLTGDLAVQPGTPYRRSAIFRCAMAFQQYCGPVMAKGVEDTAFYRYNRFIALNEVGGTPERFGLSVEHVHAANRVRAARWPSAMLATSTHDTKRGEDTRARLTALSTIPDDWERAVRAWSEILQLASGSPSRPDRNDRYLLFQLLVGTWPVELLGEGPLDPVHRDAYVERLRGVLQKSMREAKVYSTWTTPDEGYEAGMMALLDAALRGTSATRFLQSFRPFADRVAALGAYNTFAQTVLKFTVPGMPDTYQGSESWDLTMVDPDNRRPIAYDERVQAWREIEATEDRRATLHQLWSSWQDGRFKLALTAWLLQLRRASPALFATGGYEPLHVSGSRGDAVFAFARLSGNQTLVTVCRIFPGEEIGEDVMVELPEAAQGRQGRDVLTGRTFTADRYATATLLLAGLPAAAYLF